MYVLGINAAFHDSSAALLRDGIPVAAAEEERFTRIKHGKRPMPFLSHQLPFHAIEYCLDEAAITLGDVDHIAYSYDPHLAHAREGVLKTDTWDSGFGRWGEVFLAGIESAPSLLVDDVPHHLSHMLGDVRSAAQLPPFEFVDHHLSHAASAYYVSGYREAAILTLDGRGEHATTLHARGDGASIHRLKEVHFPNSFGLLYERVTTYLGFLRSSDEYKVMALASTGSPRFIPAFERLVELSGDGGYSVSDTDLVELFGPARRRGEPLEDRHFDIAYALQKTLEHAALDLAGWLHRQTGLSDLCMAGGVALNCVMNAVVREQGPFQRVFIQPAAGDAGTSLGAACVVDARERGQATPYVMNDAYLGPGYSDDDILRSLQRAGVPFERPPDIAHAAAELLAQDHILGWFQGRMEFGPRALGARSMIASPRDPDMKDRLNTIKDREEFRPVAPAVLEERAHEYFANVRPDPFMLFVADVRPEKAAEIPSVRHSDGTARVQTVSPVHAPLFHRLISAFDEQTGIPVVVNTSFNSLGRPIVCSPQDALECYYTTPLDALAIGPFLLRKGP